MQFFSSAMPCFLPFDLNKIRWLWCIISLWSEFSAGKNERRSMKKFSPVALKSIWCFFMSAYFTEKKQVALQKLCVINNAKIIKGLLKNIENEKNFTNKKMCFVWRWIFEKIAEIKTSSVVQKKEEKCFNA